jgi:hypothetical protein
MRQIGHTAARNYKTTAHGSSRRFLCSGIENIYYFQYITLWPVLARREWDALGERQRAEPIFDMRRVHAQFDRAAYERDGYVVWEATIATGGEVILMPL